MSYVPLTPVDLILAALLLVANASISLAFRLKLEKSIAIAVVRMLVQLALISIVLKFVFAQTSPLWTAMLGLVMVIAAGIEVMSRQQRPVGGWNAFGLQTATLFFIGMVVTGLGVGVIIEPDPWYAPRYILPILGMVLSNTLTGMCLVLDTLTETVNRERAAIEARLALGAPRFEALGDALRVALRTGMIPILNAMATTGIVALPGMMTGQILAGVAPVEAAKYQVLIMFLIAGATALGAVCAGLSAIILLTDDRHRLRLDRVRLKA